MPHTLKSPSGQSLGFYSMSFFKCLASGLPHLGYLRFKPEIGHFVGTTTPGRLSLNALNRIEQLAQGLTYNGERSVCITINPVDNDDYMVEACSAYLVRNEQGHLGYKLGDLRMPMRVSSIMNVLPPNQR